MLVTGFSHETALTLKLKHLQDFSCYGKDDFFFFIQFSATETVLSSIMDEFPSIRKSKARTIGYRAGCIFVFFLLGLPMTTGVTSHSIFASQKWLSTTVGLLKVKQLIVGSH